MASIFASVNSADRHYFSTVSFHCTSAKISNCSEF